MSVQIKIEEKPGLATDGLPMDLFPIVDYCRACLSIECSLTEITSLDHDSIKFSDKLIACIAEVMWLKEDLPSLICSSCIERLRVAYDFRNVCLQSDRAFARYISQMQDESKLGESQVGSTSPLHAEGKFECTDTQIVLGTLSSIQDEPPYSPQIHFLDDNDGCLENAEQSMQMGEAREKQLEPVIDIINRQHNIENPESTEVTQTIKLLQQQLTQQHNEPPFQQEPQVQQQSSKQKQKIKQTTDVQKQSHSSSDYPCTMCTKIYRSYNSYRDHMLTHLGGTPYKCMYCEKQYASSNGFQEHLRRHTGEKRFQCTVCNKQFYARSELTSHMITHTGVKPFACTICGHRCSRALALKEHMRQHTGEKPYSCDICGKKFPCKGNLKTHVKKIHNTARQFTCKICGKILSNLLFLNRHMKEHTGEKRRCTICDKVCVTPSQLRKHIKQQHKTCSYCGKEFTELHVLEEHMRSHNGEKPYLCSICGKMFKAKISLGLHMRIHTGEKVYSCTICDKKFATSLRLWKHSKIHEKK